MSDARRDPGATEELDSLLGAYALDALDPDDRVRVDAYLEHDAAARAEVDDMHETAASLAMLPAETMDAPPELWDRIAGAIAAERAATAALELGRDVGELDELAAAAAAAIVVVVLAAQVSSLHGQLNRAHQLGPAAMAAAFDRAAKTDGARETGLTTGSGATLARVVLLPDGTGYLRGDHLAPLPSDRTYQLWAVTGDAKKPVTVSAGVLGPDPQAVSFRASGPVRAFAVTIEHAGGVVQSANQPIASAALT